MKITLKAIVLVLAVIGLVQSMSLSAKEASAAAPEPKQEPGV